MVICPWCGTNYVDFQSNCTNCGGPILLPAGSGRPPAEPGGPAASVPVPPLPPRQLPGSYASRLMWAEGWAVAGLVFAILGTVFSLVGFLLTILAITVFVGLPFLFLGLACLAGGGTLLYWRYRIARRMLEVARNGQAILGEVVHVDENYHVRITHRHPWIVGYRFSCLGQEYIGQVNSLRPPSAATRPGSRVYVLYDPQCPQWNTLYPDF